MLFTIHSFGAMMTKTPELAMTEDETRELGKAITRVTELYDIPIMDEKTLAWVGLFMVAGKIYGPRMVAVSINRRKTVQPRPIVVPPVQQQQRQQQKPIPDFMASAAGVM